MEEERRDTEGKRLKKEERGTIQPWEASELGKKEKFERDQIDLSIYPLSPQRHHHKYIPRIHPLTSFFLS